MKKKNLLILGGKSDIGIETAKKIFANADFDIQFAGRNMDQSKDEIMQKVNNPNIECAFYELDILNQDGSFPNFIKSLKKFPDVLLCSIGQSRDRKLIKEIHHFYQ